jgi:hypothetical protein
MQTASENKKGPARQCWTFLNSVTGWFKNPDVFFFSKTLLRPSYSMKDRACLCQLARQKCCNVQQEPQKRVNFSAKDTPWPTAFPLQTCRAH